MYEEQVSQEQAMERWQQWRLSPTSEPIVLYPVCSGSPEELPELVDLVSGSDEPVERRSEALHNELVEFAVRCLPTRREAVAVEAILATVSRAATVVVPLSQVELFGSKAAGLSLPVSDVDIVILRTPYDVCVPREEFSNEHRAAISEKLSSLHVQLMPFMNGRGKLIPATVPILRVEMPAHGMLFKVDISMAVSNSVSAVTMIRSILDANPAVQPLMVVLKALLKQENVNEVYQGGMSSYALFNTVVAHLMMEKCFNQPQKESDTSEYRSTLDQNRRTRCGLAALQLPLGDLLLSFLKRFGNWDGSRAVSIRAQGTIPITQLENVIIGRSLYIEDPQAQGRDASRGSFAMPNVLRIFRDAAKTLWTALREDTRRPVSSRSLWILNRIIDCEDYLKRPNIPDAKKRRSNSSRGLTKPRRRRRRRSRRAGRQVRERRR